MRPLGEDAGSASPDGHRPQLASGAPASRWAFGAGRDETARARVGVWRAAAAHRCGLGIPVSPAVSCCGLHEGQAAQARPASGRTAAATEAETEVRQHEMKQTVQCYAGQRSCSVSAVQQVSSERRWTVIRRTMTASTFLWHARACPLQRKAQIQILGRIGLLRVVLFDNLVWDPCTPSRLNDSGRGKSLISSVRARC